jgi:hypothetical protein
MQVKPVVVRARGLALLTALLCQPRSAAPRACTACKSVEKALIGSTQLHLHRFASHVFGNLVSKIAQGYALARALDAAEANFSVCCTRFAKLTNKTWPRCSESLQLLSDLNMLSECRT